MEIKYLGHSSFQIKTKTARVITDPFDAAQVGLKYPKQEADIVTISHQHADHNASAQIGGEPLVLTWPGEFEKNSVRVFGFQSFHDNEQGAQRGENVVYKFETEDLSIVHCGDLGHIPTNDFIDHLGGVDILMVPVGGFYTIDSSQAVDLIKKLEPSIVIPMHFGRPELNQATYANLEPVDNFLKKIGAEGREPLDKLVVKKEDIAAEETKVVMLKISA